VSSLIKSNPGAFWACIVFVAVVLFFAIRSVVRHHKSRKEESGAYASLPQPRIQEQPVEARNKEEERKEEEEKEEEDDEEQKFGVGGRPWTWEEMQKSIDFGKYHAKLQSRRGSLNAQELDILLEHGWKLFLVDDGTHYLEKVSDRPA